MTTYRGLDGHLSFGGKVNVTAGNVLNVGARTVGVTQITLDGTGFKGVLVAGDTFTVAGETGTPVHTVTGGPFWVAAAGTIINMTITPGFATGGIADNAVVTIASQSVGEAKLWNLQSSVEVMDSSTYGTAWRKFVGGIAVWSGDGTAWLDKDDAVQGRVLDDLLQAIPSNTLNGVLFGVTNSLKQFYAGAILSGFSIAGAALGSIVEVNFQFQGSGALGIDWN